MKSRPRLIWRPDGQLFSAWKDTFHVKMVRLVARSTRSPTLRKQSHSPRFFLSGRLHFGFLRTYMVIGMAELALTTGEKIQVSHRNVLCSTLGQNDFQLEDANLIHTHTRTNGDSVRGHRISIVIRSPFSQCFDHSLPTLASRSAIGSFSCGRDVPSVDPWPEFFSCLELFPLSYIHTFTYVDTRTGKHLCKGRISLIIYSKILFLINAHRCYSIPSPSGSDGKDWPCSCPLDACKWRWPTSSHRS